MSENKKIDFSSNKLKKNYRRPTIEEALLKKQVRYWGIKKISRDILERHKESIKQGRKVEKLIKDLIIRVSGLKGSLFGLKTRFEKVKGFITSASRREQTNERKKKIKNFNDELLKIKNKYNLKMKEYDELTNELNKLAKNYHK